MALLYSISADPDDQREEVEAFLNFRWSDVLEQVPVLELRNELTSAAWTAESFEVLEVEVDDVIRARFSFEAKGLDLKSKPSGDRIDGTATAVIDEYDRIQFLDIEVG